MPNNSKMLSPKQVARELNVSLSEVYKLIKSPENPIPHYKIRGTYRISEQEFLEWLKQQHRA